MGDSAEKLAADHLTVAGLEHVLEADDTCNDLSPGDRPATGDPPSEMWTLEMAMRHLGVTKRTVLRKLKTRELTGYKVPGPYGHEWRIYPGDSPDDTASDLSPPALTPGDPEESPGVTVLVEELRRQITELKSENQALQKALQGANWRNGYLESQVQSQTEQIQLLTDSEHSHRRWWHRFMPYFNSSSR